MVYTPNPIDLYVLFFYYMINITSGLKREISVQYTNKNLFKSMLRFDKQKELEHSPSLGDNRRRIVENAACM